MTKPTIATLFGGFGGVELGALAAGLTPIWSIEHDALIAEVARENLRHDVHLLDILDCDPFDFEATDILHASPPCPNFSQANANSGESPLDIALASKVSEFISALRPKIFSLENVWAYRLSDSWRIIEGMLTLLGYWVDMAHVNAADFGVPQTRKRMIVRAIHGGFVPYLPQPQPWVGWYAAIEDIIDTLPETQFASWQMARLPALLATTMVGTDSSMSIRGESEPSTTLVAGRRALQVKAFLMADGGNTNFEEAHPGRGCRYEDEPAHTVTAISKEGGAMPKAWLVDGANASPVGMQLTTRDDTEPSFTVTTGGPKHPLRSLLACGRVVAMTPRALARFQSFPDWYELPDNARHAAKGIGNAVPPPSLSRTN